MNNFQLFELNAARRILQRISNIIMSNIEDFQENFFSDNKSIGIFTISYNENWCLVTFSSKDGIRTRRIELQEVVNWVYALDGDVEYNKTELQNNTDNEVVRKYSDDFADHL